MSFQFIDKGEEIQKRILYSITQKTNFQQRVEGAAVPYIALRSEFQV